MRKIHEHPLFLDHFRENQGVFQVFPHRFLRFYPNVRATPGRLSNILLPVPGPAIAAPAGGAATPAGFVHGGYPNEIPKVWQSSRRKCRKWWSALQRSFGKDQFGSKNHLGSPVFVGGLEFWVPRPAVNVHIQPRKISTRDVAHDSAGYRNLIIIIPAEKRLNPNKSYCKYFLRRYVYQ